MCVCARALTVRLAVVTDSCPAGKVSLVRKITPTLSGWVILSESDQLVKSFRQETACWHSIALALCKPHQKWPSPCAVSVLSGLFLVIPCVCVCVCVCVCERECVCVCMTVCAFTYGPGVACVVLMCVCAVFISAGVCIEK